MSEYRKAISVALYDANSLITVDGYENPIHEFQLKQTFISGYELQEMIEYLGIDLLPSRKLGNQEFELFYEKTRIYGDDLGKENKITDISVRVNENSLDILVKIDWGDSVSDGGFSYSGKYLIYWGENDN